MPYALKTPDPQDLIATQGNMQLYATIGDCPLYANVRLIAPGRVGKRVSFRLGWIIEEQRLANGKDKFVLQDAVLDWVDNELGKIYPDLFTATGMSVQEIADVKAEQAAKRKEHKDK